MESRSRASAAPAESPRTGPTSAPSRDRIPPETSHRKGHSHQIRAKPLACQTLPEGRRPHLTGITERLARHCELILMNAVELRDHHAQHLLLLDQRNARNGGGDHDVAPTAEIQDPVDSRDQ